MLTGAGVSFVVMVSTFRVSGTHAGPGKRVPRPRVRVVTWQWSPGRASSGAAAGAGSAGAGVAGAAAASGAVNMAGASLTNTASPDTTSFARALAVAPDDRPISRARVVGVK